MTQGLPPGLRDHGADFPAVAVIPQQKAGVDLRHTECPGVNNGSPVPANALPGL